MKRFSWLLVPLLLALGPAQSFGETVTPELVPAPCEFGRTVQAWQGQVNCYRLRVPETRGDADTRYLDLAVYELIGRNGAAGEPVVYLAGGPGVGADYYVDVLLRHPVRDDRSIIIMEQRGIGLSGELCPSVRVNYYRRVAATRNNDRRRRQFIGLMRSCINGLRDDGVDVDAYTTEEIARDLADLRAALGYDRLNLWAVSYGTVLAQSYLRLEPNHVGSLILDATVPIDYVLEENLTANFRRVLLARWESCVADGACNPEAASFVARLEEIIPAYNHRPLRLLGFSPEPSIVVNFVYVTGVDAAGIVYSLLYEQASYEAIDRLLSLLERQSASFLRAHYQRLAVPGFSFGMHYAVNCRGADLDDEGMDALREQDPLLFDALQVGLQHELCGVIDLEPAAPDANDPVAFDGPALVLSGEFDPITPLSLAEPLRTRFPNAAFLEIEGGGHGPSRSLPCAQDMVRHYLADGVPPTPDICSPRAGP